MRPNQTFVNLLHGHDPLLSVYWGNFVKQWVVARKSHVSETELGYMHSRRDRLARLIPNFTGHPNQLERMKNTQIGLSEEILAAQEGKRIVLFAHKLTQNVYDALILADMARYGGYSRLADEMEQIEDRAETEIERRQSEQRIAMNKEVFDQLNFLWRKRQDSLLNGSRDLGQMLHGKRSAGAGPLLQVEDF